MKEEMIFIHHILLIEIRTSLFAGVSSDKTISHSMELLLHIKNALSIGFYFKYLSKKDMTFFKLASV